MKKILFLLFAMMITVGLVACDESDKEESKDVSTVESSDDNDDEAETEEAGEAEEDSEDGNEVEEFAKEIVDNDKLKATLTSVKHIKDEEWDEERYEVMFDVENKWDETVEVQAREVSADGKMVDESMLVMSKEIAAGKKGDAVLKIESFDSNLPAMEEDLEMKLHVFSWDDMEFEEDYDVKVEFE